jgi:hypothetical protein
LEYGKHIKTGVTIEEEDDKPYESVEDWKKEVRYIKWPVIILIIFITVLFIFIAIYLPYM